MAKFILFLNLSLMFISCSRVPVIVKPEPFRKDILESRVSNLFEILSRLRINHIETRKAISEFFLNKKDLDSFVVQTTLKFKKAHIYRMKVDYYKIINMKIEGNKAFVHIKYEGRKRFPLFQGEIEEVQQWAFVGDTWYLVPQSYVE